MGIVAVDRDSVAIANTSVAGFSLIELMVALVAGIIVSGAVIAFTMSSMRSNGEYVQSTRLTQELRNSLDLVTRELHRAGYDDGALAHMSTSTGSPFGRILLANPVSPATTPASYNCVLYSYDRTGGAPGTPEQANGEIRGLRLVQATIGGQAVGVIEYGVSDSSGKPNCATESTPTYASFPPACHSLWCPLSDPKVLNITALSFVDNRILVGTVPNQVWLRDIGVTLQGQLARSTEFTRGVTTKVRVRADCFNPTMSTCNATP